MAAAKEAQRNTKKKRKLKTLGVFGLIAAFFIFVILLANSLLSILIPHFYPTIGQYKFIAVTTDAVADDIPKGNMIIVKKPSAEELVSVGSIVTFETDGEHGLITHTLRVSSIDHSGETAVYTVFGENTIETFDIGYSQIIGIYINKKCGFFGYFFGFFNSAAGAIILTLIFAAIVVFYILTTFLRRSEERRKLQADALDKCARELSGINLRFDNIREITAVMDVLNMITVKPTNRAEAKKTYERLHSFINAENIELPQTPEIAAVLDTLPAPDTPLTLAAALRNGATLRQAEDGQTLILTGMSGGRSIMLTPVQTSDGIVLCQQGVRLRADVAPNIETVGAMSMPEYPEFFEGQPLKKNIVYPELPQPSYVFGAEMLSPHNSYVPAGEMLASLMSAPVTPAEAAALDGGKKPQALPSHETPSAALPEHEERKSVKHIELPSGTHEYSGSAENSEENARARAAYEKYLEEAHKSEIKQTEELNALLETVVPLTPEEQRRIDKYKTADAKTDDGKTKRKKSLTAEQLAARREAAALRKAEKDGFISVLGAAEKERYLAEQKLSKSRADTIKKLKSIAADRKLLEKLD